MYFLKKCLYKTPGLPVLVQRYKLFFLMVCCLWLTSCQTIDLYERVTPVPKHQWQSRFRPTFRFEIRDTTVPYQLYIILRHNEKYNYNNIWLNLYAKPPQGPAQKFTVELPLATNDRGWLGSGIDDIYDHRIALTLDPGKFNFAKRGTYSFTVEHIMREDPLENVMNVGVRIEKRQP